MTQDLNTYQVSILIELNKLPLIYRDFKLIKGVWLSNDLSLNLQTVNDWENQLITQGYVTKEEDTSQLYRIPYIVNLDSGHPRIKVVQKGRDYLALLATPIK